MSPDLQTVEGIARVVSVDGSVAWLEPEQTTSCGSCASAASCGSGSGDTGIGTVAKRIAARRFALDNVAGLSVGERVVIGVDHRALIKGALTAYALPLLLALGGGSIAEAAWGNDLASMATMVTGLLLGLLAARVVARHLGARGELAPRFLRRAAATLPPKSPDGDLPPGGQKHLGRPGVFRDDSCNGSAA